jgi:hypothetical protein
MPCEPVQPGALRGGACEKALLRRACPVPLHGTYRADKKTARLNGPITTT